ncbi:MAG TPA: gamma-glutamyl-gamma-aminobutyrate hydrolase family protein [Nitrospiraceae bacterium]|nr:gamma-glutamyl-gamma-aminobutyrate hydrolase family protein [Nitrospiraceae bacterium]
MARTSLSKPLIGITPDLDPGDRDPSKRGEPTYFLRARYIKAIEDLGGVPVILPLVQDRRVKRQLLRDLQGLLLTGSGPDLPPKLYGERQKFDFRLVSRPRYEFELEMARLAAESKMPVLGICGGMQAINVAFGGSLIQDIPSQVSAALAHRGSGSATRFSHQVRVSPDSLLHRIVRQTAIRVNSSHHQSVKKVAPTLVVSAIAPDGVIEAIEAPALPFLLGVQWHPEFLYDHDEVQRRLFRAFLRAASAR